MWYCSKAGLLYRVHHNGTVVIFVLCEFYMRSIREVILERFKRIHDDEYIPVVLNKLPRQYGVK
jgi:hypothetical protein